jgi:O-antigen/teichoic acid export membrane protein
MQQEPTTMTAAADIGAAAIADGNRRELRTIAVSAAARGCALLGQLLMIRWLVRSLGQTGYGVWATIVSSIALLGLVQLGVTPSLLNRLSGVSRRDDVRARQLVSTATALQLALAALGSACVLLFGHYVPWWRFFNLPAGDLDLHAQAAAACIVCAVVLFVRLPASIPGAVSRALQRGYIDAAIQIAATATAVVATFLLTRGKTTLLVVAIAQQVAPMLVTIAFGIVILGANSSLRPRYRDVSSREARALLGSGAHFTIVGIASFVIAGTDNLVISHYIGPSAVATYSVTFFLAQLLVQAVMLLLDASWPRWAEAAARRDVEWLRTHHRAVSRKIALLLLGGGAVVMFAGRTVIGFWAGKEVVPSYALLGAIVLLTVTQGLFLSTGRLVTALGAVSTTAALGLLNAAVNLPVSILLAKHLGIIGVALGTFVAYVAVGWILFPVSRRLLTRLASSDTMTPGGSRA